MIAVIDIGSNSVRLMLWAGGKSFYKSISTTRLGEGLHTAHRLLPEAMERSVCAVENYVALARQKGAEQIYAFATAAVRTAENGAEFCRCVLEKTGISIDVVNGEQEAMLAVSGALGKNDGIVVDVGGASSEVCCVKGGKVCYSHSFPAGAVTLCDDCASEAQLRDCVAGVLEDLPALEGKVYAVGGTASTLACVDLELETYDAERVQDHYLSTRHIGEMTDRLFSLSVEERRALRGMDERRADIIVGGACILHGILRKLGAQGVFVSDRDNLEGYLCVRGLA